MAEIICYTPNIPEGNEKIISFMDILLNDQLAEGLIQCPESVYAEIGDVNKLLSQKQNYEFLLRAAKRYPIKAVGSSSSSCYNHSSFDEDGYQWECFKTDCYITAKYQSELLESGHYPLVMKELAARSMSLPYTEEGLSWLRKMIAHSDEYWRIDSDTLPILIYRADDSVEKVLLSFTDQLAAGLRLCHQRVEIFDYRQSDLYDLNKYIGQRYKAIIGVQSSYFSIQNSNTYLHDLIIGPKYNMILDHPIFQKDSIIHSPKDYFLLIHDRNYINFVKRYYKEYVKDCFQLAPAGILPSVPSQPSPKIYDISFIGTYHDYRQDLPALYARNPWTRHFAARCLRFLKQDPSLTVEKSLEKTISSYGLQADDKTFEELFYNLRYLSTIIAYYYREKSIAALLNANITIHVFGDTWSRSPFARHPHCILHPNLSMHKTMEVLQKSKISLNIMKWHKDGFTERISNSLLCQSLVLSDKSQYLEENFINGTELVLFDLSKLELLPSIVNRLLSDSALLEYITANGHKKALEQHLWIHRAKQFLDILENQ